MQTSFPQVSLIIRNPMLLEEPPEFALEVLHSMVRFLVIDVLSGCFHLRTAYCKRAITCLPTEMLELGEMLVNPAGRVRFDISQRLGNTALFVDTGHAVNMIR